MQGFNMGRYVPPDKEGIISGNRLHRKPTTPPTIRFEMPFAVWCLTCCPDPQSTEPNTPRPVIIGQGVRFNAVKKKVGMYHTSTIWGFTMKHNVCGGELEIRTDPKNTEYICYSGCRRRDQGSEEVLRGRDGGLVEAGKEILTDAERERLRKDAFGRLERTIEDREQLKAAKSRIEELEGRSERDWGDDYARNQALRKTFRVGRKEREKAAKGDEELRERLGWGEDSLLEKETEEDGLRAGLVDFRPVGDDERMESSKALAKPLFGGTRGNMTRKGLLKEEKVLEKRKGEFKAAVMGNTRVVTDPFLHDGEGRRASGLEKRIPGVKRKREVVASDERTELEGQTGKSEAKKLAAGGLVDYGSESD